MNDEEIRQNDTDPGTGIVNPAGENAESVKPEEAGQKAESAKAEEAGQKAESANPAETGQKPENANPDTAENRETKPKDWRKELLSWVIVIGVAAALAFAINRFVLMKTVITSSSMRPTMEVDEHVIANRLAYLFSDPKRGDMVFFANPDDESETYVKRIIGLPGEKVEIKKGKIYINDSDKPLDEPYLFEKADKENFGPYFVPEDCYFMLGDNRNISHDARYWDNTFVSRDKIYGKAWFGYRVRKMKSAEY